MRGFGMHLSSSSLSPDPWLRLSPLPFSRSGYSVLWSVLPGSSGPEVGMASWVTSHACLPETEGILGQFWASRNELATLAHAGPGVKQELGWPLLG